MRRCFAAMSGWRVGVIAGALLIAALVRPVLGDEAPLPGSMNKNLTATAQYSASTEWQSDQGNTTFVAAKSFDGDLTTRWNSYSGDGAGAWLAAKWSAPVTINKAVLREAFDRITGMHVQTWDTSKNDWVDASVVEDPDFTNLKKLDASGNATLTVRLPQSIQTTGIRWLFDNANSTSLSVWEAEAWNSPAGSLTGTVTDSSGAPVPGATVSAGADQAVTDAAGKYTLVTDAGTYDVTAAKTGYRNRIARGLVLSASVPASHNFVLIPTLPNLALTATADASTEYSSGGYEAGKANDGKLTTRWNSDNGDTDGAYLDLVWPQAQTFNAVVIHEAYDRIRNYSLQMYDDTNAKYVDIPGASNIAVPARGGDASVRDYLASYLPAAVTSKRLRLLVIHADSLPSVWELEVYNAPPTAVGTVTGVVSDVTSGKPVANALITDDQGEVLAAADANGAFSLPLQPDDYVVTASAAGYFTGAPASFTINGGDKQNITVTAPAQGADIALTAKASASTEDASWPATNVNDGDPTTYWQATDVTNQWVALTWANPTTFTAVQLQGFQGVIESSHLESTTDGKTWTPLPGTVFNPENAANAGITAPFFFFPSGVTATGLRYFIIATNSVSSIPGLSEMRVFDSPIPKPSQ